MSGGESCKCDERKKPPFMRLWFVTQRMCNHSAFNGNRYTPSAWSAIRCDKCGASWRTRATYVYSLRDAVRE